MTKFRNARALFYVDVLVCSVVALLFTIVMVQASLRKGKLLLPVTYDDVMYCIDGLERLQALYDGGLKSFVASLISSPPHAPSSTVLAMISYLSLGIHDWAPYMGNSVVVFCYLIFVLRLLKKAPPVYRIAGFVLAATIPVTMNAVNEFRPDIFCGLVTAIAMVVIAGNVVLRSGMRKLLSGAGLMAAALLIKPTFAPATLFFCSVSAALAIAGRRLIRKKKFVFAETAWRAVFQIALGVAIALPFFFLVWRRLYEYIISNAFGSNKHLWAVQRTFIEQALYFINGLGGDFMLGRHLGLLILLLGCGVFAMWRTFHGFDLLCHAFFLALCSVAYVLPTRMEVKSPFSGVQFTFLLIFWALFAFSRFARRAARWRAPIRSAASILALVLAVVGVLWMRFPVGTAGADSSLRNQLVAHDYEFLRQKVLERAQQGDTSPLVVTLTTAGLSHNASVFQYLLLKNNLRSARFIDLHREGRIEIFGQAFAESDIVMANQPNREEAYEWLPSGKIQKQTLELIQNRNDFHLASEYSTVAGRKYYIFERITGFSSNLKFDGFGDLEGPYPQWRLPRVRWGLGPRSRIEVLDVQPGSLQLLLSAASYRPNQAMDITVDGKEMLRYRFAKQGEFESLAIPLTLAGTVGRIEFAYDSWASAEDSDPRPRAVLFRCIRVFAQPATVDATPCASLTPGIRLPALKQNGHSAERTPEFTSP